MTAFLILLMSLFPSKETTIPVSKRGDFIAYIVQGEKKFPVKNNVIQLAPAPFQIIFEFPEPHGVEVSASFDKSTFEKVNSKIHYRALPGFVHIGMAEEWKNLDRSIIVADSAASYWWYDTDEKNRFDSIQIVEGKIICFRSVDFIHNRFEKNKINISQIVEPLYLVFVTSDYVDNKWHEYKRKGVCIKWHK
ncbi:MAG: hypothetical protein SFW35_01165 [Chitinophagales bacterium]|nr:hypothetical protein [Chitinophagales bacterium]